MPGEEQQLQVTVATENRNLKISPFMHAADDQIGIGNEWQDWLEELERELRYFKITDPVDKKDSIIIYGGKEISRLAKNLPDPAEGDVYEKLKCRLNDYYTP